MISRQPVHRLRPWTVATIGLVIWLSGSMRAVAQWPTASSINSEQVMVLKNGEVFQGKINRLSTQVEIQTQEGSRLVIGNDRVDFICDSMEQAYWEKYGLTKASDTSGQIALFQWCLKHHLIRHAENQIQLLSQSEIKATQLDFLNRQLRVASAQLESQHAPAVPPADPAAGEYAFRPLPPMTSEPPLANSGKWLQPVPVEREAPMVQQVEYQQPIEDARAEAELAQIQFNQQLDAEMRDLPRGTVGNFRRLVEPLLLQSCQNAGCHNAESTFPLVSSRAEINPLRLSQRNLHHLMLQIDRQALAESAAWLAATQPHAGQADPLFDLNSRERSQLEAWLITLADDTAQPPVAIPEDSASNAITDRDAIPQPIPALDSPLTAAPLPPRNELKTIGDIPRLGEPAAAAGRGSVPLDPFDPEIFNRQKHGGQ